MNYELSALLVGFLGSFHCVVMCGPIALALSGGQHAGWSYYKGRTVYNLGRITTYALLGLLAGAIGKTFVLAGFQQYLSIIIGSIMIIGVVLTYAPAFTRLHLPWILALNKLIKNIFSSISNKKSNTALYTAGLANGMLPCGFVYLAMAGAAVTQQPYNGSFYMILFGLGTFPAMMVVSFFGKTGNLRFRNTLIKAAPVLMILLGSLLVYRGYTDIVNGHCHQHAQISVAE